MRDEKLIQALQEAFAAEAKFLNCPDIRRAKSLSCAECVEKAAEIVGGLLR